MTTGAIAMTAGAIDASEKGGGGGLQITIIDMVINLPP